MNKKELLNICSQIDSRIKLEKDKKQALAVSKGYTYFSEYVYKEYKKRSAVDIHNEILAYGILKIAKATVWGVKNRVTELHGRNTISKDVKICYLCKKRPVPPENHAICLECDRLNKRKASLIEEHTGAGYFF
jgi:hypothetical protein